MATNPKLLDRIHTPADLRGLSPEELPRVAEELRTEILGAICETGGHLASSLGVVELTVALHYVFNTPEDRLIWDVGHQTYPHKILTGRRDRFASIRCLGGLSGFPKRAESEFDSFGTGHASTSISAAMGMAEALRRSGRPGHVVAIIGDGGLTGGMALEALNQTRKDLSNMTVILNDNEMSIAPSVGRLSTFLTGSLVSKQSYRFIRLLRRLLQPVLPGWLYEEARQLGRRWRQSLLTFWTPGTLFEGLGYHYLGPIDGHDLPQLINNLRRAREVEEPVLLHVLTKKGKGYQFAEDLPGKFHGIGPFDLATGQRESAGGSPTYTEIFSRALCEEMARDERVVAITAAMPQGTGLDRAQQEFPGRVYDMGITEPHCVTFAAGMACEGYRPVVAIYSTFLQRAYDQLLHDVSLQGLPVVFCLDRAGIVGEDGPTHHGLFDLSFLRQMPGMAVLAPADENELRNLLHTALVRGEGPAAIRFPRDRGTGAPLDISARVLPWGKAEVRREGRDVVIAAAGNSVAAAEQAAALLAAEGIEATVINARFVKPLDKELIVERVAAAGAVVTVEENVVLGGFGDAVAEALSSAGVFVPVLRLGVSDDFIEHGPPEELRRAVGIDADGIARSTVAFVRAHRK